MEESWRNPEADMSVRSAAGALCSSDLCWRTFCHFTRRAQARRHSTQTQPTRPSMALLKSRTRCGDDETRQQGGNNRVEKWLHRGMLGWR